jgi:hypothetical protein
VLAGACGSLPSSCLAAPAGFRGTRAGDRQHTTQVEMKLGARGPFLFKHPPSELLKSRCNTDLCRSPGPQSSYCVQSQHREPRPPLSCGRQLDNYTVHSTWASDNRSVAVVPRASFPSRSTALPGCLVLALSLAGRRQQQDRATAQSPDRGKQRNETSRRKRDPAALDPRGPGTESSQPISPPFNPQPSWRSGAASPIKTTEVHEPGEMRFPPAAFLV